MSSFVCTPLFLKVVWVTMETMKFHITKMHVFLGQYFFLHLSGPIEQIYTHKEMFYVFNVGLITPFDSSLSNGFPTFIIFH